MDPITARSIAYSGHGEQLDRSGGLVVDHVERVAAAVPDEARSVAFLHDLLERTGVAASDLSAQGMTPVELAALQLLTRAPEESFEAHALRIAYAKGPEADIARAVKLADIDDHVLHDGAAVPARPYGWARRHVAARQLYSGRPKASPASA